MRILSALILDEIRENEEGGVDLIGLREELYFDAVPVVLERLSLFVHLAVDTTDLGKRHTLAIRIVDPEETVQKTTPIRFTLPADYPRRTAPLDPSLFEIPFERFGAHRIEISLGGDEIRVLPLDILPREADDRAAG